MIRDKAIEEIENYENYPNGLSKECRDYIIKALEQEPKTKIEESNFSREQYVLDIDTAWKCGYEAGKKESSPVNICPHCGEYIGAESEEV